MWFPFFSELERKIITGRSGLGSELTLFYLNVYMLSPSHFNLGVGPKGQDITKKNMRLESGAIFRICCLRLVSVQTGFLPNRARCGAWVGWGFFSRRLRA